MKYQYLRVFIFKHYKSMYCSDVFNLSSAVLTCKQAGGKDKSRANAILVLFLFFLI